MADLDEIVSYIAADRPAASEREGGAIVRKADFLEEFPHLGSIYHRAAEADYRSVMSGNYRIIYYIKPEAPVVDIVAIRHAARDLPDFL